MAAILKLELFLTEWSRSYFVLALGNINAAKKQIYKISLFYLFELILPYFGKSFALDINNVIL